VGTKGPRSRGRRTAAPGPRGLACRREPGPGTGPLTGLSLPPVALYLHVPFCVSLCPYCDFVVYPGAAARGPSNRIAAFVAALRVELELRAKELDGRFGRPGSKDRPALTSVYFGGGTPSLLASEVVAGLLDLVRRRFGIETGAEITLEANPGPDERGEAVAWRQAGITRLSFGAQSLDPAELTRLGRRHAPADVAAAVREARDAGIGSISLDLLYDVPGQTVASWERTLDGALALEPDHLSLYALTLDDPAAEGLTGATGDHLPTPAGARRWRARARPEQDDDAAAAMYELASERLAATGWRGYEISNWARPGHESRHNLAYWQRLPCEAVGPGAHAFDGERRRWNAARLDGYLAALTPAAGGPSRLPPGGIEAIDHKTAEAEAAILGLRTDDGIPATAAGPFAAPIAWARELGLLDITGDERLVLTTRGRLLCNEVFIRLLPTD
jgi:oxygen-independent coproporphyrinogen-3 oxidase